MKLNYDLIRNLLLTAENQEQNSSLSQKELDDFIKKYDYTFEELIYHLKRLEEADYITIHTQTLSNQTINYKLKVWNVTKDVAKDLKIKSISAFSQIAVQVASNLINHYLSSK